jgi:hypothetical protein
MGPINADWIKKNGDNWSSGRLEVWTGNFDWADEEYGITIDSQHWNVFDDFLGELKTETVLTKDELCAMFENETGNKLIHRKV